MWNGTWYVPELRVLNLRNNTLTGIIPPSIGNATKLMNISLNWNRINGNIPMQIGNLSQLVELTLSRNQLTGSIPSTLFNISSLLVVSLAYNNLSGPLFLDDRRDVLSSNIEHIGVSYNQITGHIPSNICQFKALKVLSISYNNITGEIPTNIGCLAKLEELYIGYNAIDGTIPTSLGNISTLQKLHCGNNHMEGELPLELGKLSNLRQINFEENYNLKGEIPNTIFNISSLEFIAFTFNNLSGRIPNLLHLPNLIQLLLANNQLEGEIPRHITNATNLELLELSDNLLTGTIPYDLGNLRELQELFLHHNQLTKLGFFDSLVKCRMLRYVQVGSNPLNDVLPSSIGNLSSTVEYFHIGDAQINGFIPTSTGNMSGLTTLVFQDNNLTGNIPREIEYGSEGIVSTRGDVYSYGIMLMEVLAKRRPTGEEIFNENLGLREWITRAFSRTMMEVVDTDILYDGEKITSKSELCILSMIELALDCTKATPESRITMKDVVKRLNKIKNTFLET
ncbi:hypothetical protein H5410_020078 [Solanum commersonii]|uniref:Uncharacterized protein n=1 Tax=Solanum commersonii TaxID=4109 RepID=A0A9J5Z944_SOLCO|nr:hypothetical protein H5410_020078 [Solanum commersonii]